MLNPVTPDELRKLFPHISQDCIERTCPVVGLPDTQRQPDQRSEKQVGKLEKGSESVGYRVTLISIRSKRVDAHDNLRTGAKPLVDAITRSLGFTTDDTDKLEWNYHQIIGEPRGTMVLIQVL